MMNVLISLHRGYGLGDCVQMSAVLRHVAKYRPNWVVDYQAEPGRHGVGRGIVANTFAYGEPYPSYRYDAEVQIRLYDTWANWGDRPNTRVSSALREQFDLDWDPSVGRYSVDVDQASHDAAYAMVHGIVQKSRNNFTLRNKRTKYVAVHYQGDSSPSKKNLSHDRANSICGMVEKMGCVPVILDWRSQCPLPYRRIRHPEHYGSNAEMVCAVIGCCDAFVGIDSGPSKCASATETPSLVIWTGHHPAPFHDPAPNTTHLVPVGYHGLEPVCNDSGVIRWFEANYNVRQYANFGLVPEVSKWLSEVLR